jgi:uncharacterized cupin superfamily protein
MSHKKYFFSATPIYKIRATKDIERKTINWSTWVCNEDRYVHQYFPGASFYVVRGRASLSFPDGTVVDIEAGDFASITTGAEATWKIDAEIETRYCYHADVPASGNDASGVSA